METACILDSGSVAVSSVPGGTSAGSHEALELRDTDNKRYLGKGVLRAVDNVNKVLGPEIIGMDPQDQVSIDKKLIEMDGTENKSKLGANAILAVSLACVRAGAVGKKQELYQYLRQKFWP